MKSFLIALSSLLVLSFDTNAQTKKTGAVKKNATPAVSVSRVKPDSVANQTQMQTQSPAQAPIEPVDGFYNYSILGNASPFNYPYINPANVRFYKRIWRDIDLTDPQNQVLAIPGSTLIETILDALKTGKLYAYDAADDGFKARLTSQQAIDKLIDSVLVPVFDHNGNQIDAKMRQNDFNPARVAKFRIKEDIFFDKQRSKIETRIIGLAPLISVQTNDITINETPAFWLYFPECRNVFVKKDVSNPDKKMYEMSMDDIFLQRKFTSKIIKESNTTGQRIIDYTQDSSEQAKEAQRIENGIEEYKRKVWGYNENK